jgi:type IV secretory pathway VirB4 component
LRSILEARLIYIKPALYQQKEGLISSFPYGSDLLQIHNTLNTTPLSSIFPFVSFDLSSNEGILFGINKHNNSLVLFDRFSMENANMVILAKSGSGKSYAVKLEILRSLMMGVECIILDPENEYKTLADAVGGSFFKISLSSESHINPFDLPEPREDETAEDVLRSNIINLVGLMRIMLGGLSPEEDAIMDRALSETYAAKDITPNTDPKTWAQNVPIMSDLESVLDTMDGAESLVERLRKFTKGTFASFFNQRSNISMNKSLVVFGIRDMEDELRPMAMFIIMRYIWNTTRAELKKRILVIDEAWWMMKTEDGASFLFGICKRARKYWLGVTTITQDVSDFMRSDYGKPIITNSSIQLLLKQSPATIDLIQQTFTLTDQEKFLLLETPVGEGIFFAGQKHVAIRIVASYTEDQIITTSPEEVVKIREAKALKQT